MHSKKTTPASIPNIRVIFMGTPHFSEAILNSLIEEKYHIVAVYTQPDKPTGRKQELVKSPVKTLAEEHSITVEQPEKLDDAAVEQFRTYKPDVVIVAAYGKILPKSMLETPEHGCINIHASLLPRWRGASPIQNVLLAGDKETGITLMLMDTGVDTGMTLARRSVPIEPTDTTLLLSSTLASVGVSLLLDTLPDWIEKKIEPKEQDNSKATLCQLIDREDGRVFWNEDAESLYNRYRALTPWPGIFTFWKRDGFPLRLKLVSVSHQKTETESKHMIGEVFEVGEKIGVKTGRGILFLEAVHLEGKSQQSISDFVRGYPDFIGAILE